ncbi:MAG: tetratricopeptide repeat protein [Thermoplasmata archaeon]|nr:tetratricopeptide repeat protein [Thermoplasmata archaeon]
MDAGKFPPVLVDREKEIAVLRKAMEDCKEGRGSAVLIAGDIGTGKTRLAEEFAEMCEREHFVVLASMCLGTSEPAYLPVLTALESYARKVREEEERYLPLGLAGFQNLEVEERSPNGVTKERTRILEYLLRQFIEIAKKQPLLFIIDDLHLADSGTLAFFHYLVRNIQNERMVAVATYVEEYATSDSLFAKTLRNINIERLYTQVKLENFGEKEIQEIVEQFGFAHPKETANYIYDRTSGNPFFVVEFLAAMRSAGAVEIEAIKKMALPNSVKEIVRFLVSKLDEKARRILSICAVLGRVFEYKVLAELVGLTEEELLSSIEGLLAQNFLVETEEVEEGCKFVNNTIQEVIYEELTGVRKRLMHLKAGECIEKYHGTEERFWPSLARHYREGANKNKFSEYAIKAGRSAAKKFANAEASEFLGDALKALGESPEERQQKIEILWELAEVLELEGKYEDALELLNTRVNYTVSEQPVEAGKTHRKMAEIYTTKGDYENALVHVEKAEECLLGKSEDKFELARVWSAKAYVYERKGEYRNAIEWQERALTVFGESDGEKDTANALHRIGTCYAYLGEYERALGYLKRALQIREKINDLRGVAGVYNNIGIIYDHKGEYEKALEFYHKGLAGYEKIGDVFGMAKIYNNIGVVYDYRGEYERALEFYQKSLAIKERIGDLWGIASTSDNIGTIHRLKGDYEKALEFHHKSLALEERIGDLWGIAISYNSLGETYYQKGEYEKALEFYQKSLAIKERIGDVTGICKSCTLLGRLYLEMGDYEKALESFKRSLELAKQVGARTDECTAMLGIAEVYTEMGDLEKAFPLLEEASGVALIFGEKETVASARYAEWKFYAAKGEGKSAIEALKQVLVICEGIGRRDYYYYRTLFELGRFTGDRDLLAQALQFFERIDNRVWAEKTRIEMEKISTKQIV